MLEIEFHKGEPCPYKPILCQEGACMRCQIYEDREHKLLSAGLPDRLGDSRTDRVTNVEDVNDISIQV